MPPTRSKKTTAKSTSKAQRKSNLNANYVPPTLSSTNAAAEEPLGDYASSDTAKYTFERVRGDHLGSPLKSFYSRRVRPEFDEDPSTQGITIPQTTRPPPMSLDDLECIRTLGVSSNGRVLLASSKQSRERLPIGHRALFAVKAIRRKAYRKDISKLAALNKPIEESVLVEIARQHFRSQSKERSALVDLPWNPFVAGLVQTLQDSQALYMSLEFIPGGTLRTLLRKSPNGLGHKNASFYFGNIVCGLEFLREEGIAHRNLRPESILLGGDGYLCLSNFEAATRFDNRKCDWTMVTREYAPPECQPLAEVPTTIVPEAIDWWSSGSILFEIVTGEMAFFEESEGQSEPLESRTEEHKPCWPRTGDFDQKLVDLVDHLLEVDPVKRLGTEGVMKVMEHPWFSVLDWSRMRRRGYLAPDVPKPIDHSQLWHNLPLPKQEYIPGLKILNPYLHLAHDNRFPGRPAESV